VRQCRRKNAYKFSKTETKQRANKKLTITALQNNSSATRFNHFARGSSEIELKIPIS
jgi:hypothetical protein